MSALQSTLTDAILAIILPTLASGLQTRGITISVEELQALIGVEGKLIDSTKTKAKAKPANAKICSGKFSTGPNANKPCNRTCVENSDFCHLHAGNKTKAPATTKATGKKGPQIKASLGESVASKFPVKPTGPEETVAPTVEPWSNGLDILRGVASVEGVIVQSLGDGQYMAKGMAKDHNDPTAGMSELTAEVKPALRAFGVTYQETLPKLKQLGANLKAPTMPDFEAEEEDEEDAGF